MTNSHPPSSAESEGARYYVEGFTLYLDGLRGASALRRAHGLSSDARYAFTTGYFDAKELDAATQPDGSKS